jgi:hypothetical protein
MVASLSAVALLLGTLHGQVMRGPTTPVCIVGKPCQAPAKNVTLFFTRKDKTRTTTTDDHGRYRVRLPAGTYTVHTNLRRFGRTPRPSFARVVAARDRRVDFDIDTGIR